MVGFETMLFDYNEGLTRLGINHPYITGFDFFMNIFTTAILIFGFEKIVVASGILDKYEDHITLLTMSIVVVGPIVIGIYFHEYTEVLLFTAFVLIVLAVAIFDIFEDFRTYLDEKFGWLF
ncbi:hypothetical protein [Sulfurimonas hydrogeniphila]|uniref:hypothetical protein n=1 Tax=Sulfurimonas hydrogeniphila TaxID=2509341 RepID=UPI00125EB629|nr:hypothetical protein [Sulfurimonas hydrogeniphila]